MLLPLRGVATLGHGRGKGSAGDKFRVIGMQETVEGAGAKEVIGVLSEASCCRCGAPLIKKKRPTLFSRPLFVCGWFFLIPVASRQPLKGHAESLYDSGVSKAPLHSAFPPLRLVAYCALRKNFPIGYDIPQKCLILPVRA